MPNYTADFIVKPLATINLREYDPAYRGKHESRKTAAVTTQRHLEKMDQLQYLMYAEQKHALLIVLQGLDASGKDGVIRHVFAGINPQGCKVTSFKEPTPEELDHDFLWRVHPHAPKEGMVAIFNRSHYEDVLVDRVHQRQKQAVWSRRYDLINEFERLMVVENNTVVLKFFLHLSKEEQLVRFKQRIDDPARNWKISEADYREREHWDAYTEAYEDLFRHTSTERAPWFIIPSDHKWFRNLTVSQIITDALTGLEMQPPATTVDLKEIRRRYHEAAMKAKPGHRDPNAWHEPC